MMLVLTIKAGGLVQIDCPDGTKLVIRTEKRTKLSFDAPESYYVRRESLLPPKEVKR